MPECGGGISTVGMTLFIDDATEGTADVQIKGHNSIAFSGLESTEIETTSQCDTERQYINGLLDLGSASIAINPNYGDAGQNVVRANIGGTAIKTFKIVLPGDAADIDFTGILRTGSTDFGFDTKAEGSFDVRIRSRPQITPDGGSAANL